MKQMSHNWENISRYVNIYTDIIFVMCEIKIGAYSAFNQKKTINELLYDKWWNIFRQFLGYIRIFLYTTAFKRHKIFNVHKYRLESFDSTMLR